MKILCLFILNSRVSQFSLEFNPGYASAIRLSVNRGPSCIEYIGGSFVFLLISVEAKYLLIKEISSSLATPMSQLCAWSMSTCLNGLL